MEALNDILTGPFKRMSQLLLIVNGDLTIPQHFTNPGV